MSAVALVDSIAARYRDTPLSVLMGLSHGPCLPKINAMMGKSVPWPTACKALDDPADHTTLPAFRFDMVRTYFIAAWVGSGWKVTAYSRSRAELAEPGEEVPADPAVEEAFAAGFCEEQQKRIR